MGGKQKYDDSKWGLVNKKGIMKGNQFYAKRETGNITFLLLFFLLPSICYCKNEEISHFPFSISRPRETRREKEGVRGLVLFVHQT